MEITKQLAIKLNVFSHSSGALIIEEYDVGQPFVCLSRSYSVLESLVQRSVLCVTGQIQHKGKALLPENYVADWRKRLEQAVPATTGCQQLAGYTATVEFDPATDKGKWVWSQLERDNPALVGQLTAEQDGVIRRVLELGKLNQLETFGWLMREYGTYTLERSAPTHSAPTKASSVPEIFVDDEQLALF